MKTSWRCPNRPLVLSRPPSPSLVSLIFRFFFLSYFINSFRTGTARQTRASTAKTPATTATTGKGKKRALSPSASEPSVSTTHKRSKADGDSDVTEVAVARILEQLGPHISQLAAVGASTAYAHPSLYTVPDFVGGVPAKTVIPTKEPSGSRRIPVKRLPAWQLEPDLKTFGPYFKAAGTVYTPRDISTLARAIPDVSVFIFILILFLFHLTDRQSDLRTLSVLSRVGQGC